MEIITSVNNEFIKELRKLKQLKYRNKHQLFIVETRHLIDEAIKVNALEYVITCDYEYRNDNLKIIYVNDNVMKSISNLVSPSNYLGVCKYFNNFIDFDKDIVVLDRIQDSGNLGTILRNCLAFNYSNVIVSNDCADYMSNKVIQSSQGAIFKLNIVKEDDLISIATFLKSKDYLLIASSLDDSQSLKKIISCDDKKALFFGNEGQGINRDLLAIMDLKYRIPMNSIDSINVACANAIFLYEFSFSK